MKLLLALFLAVSPLLAEKVTFLTPSTPIQVNVPRSGKVTLRLRYYVQAEKPSDFTLHPFVGVIQGAAQGPTDWVLPTPRRFGPTTIVNTVHNFNLTPPTRGGSVRNIYLMFTYAGQPGLPIHSVALISDEE